MILIVVIVVMGMMTTTTPLDWLHMAGCTEEDVATGINPLAPGWLYVACPSCFARRKTRRLARTLPSLLEKRNLLREQEVINPPLGLLVCRLQAIYTHRRLSIGYNQNYIIEVNMTSENLQPIKDGR
jgi:hypothetical protein